MPKLKLNCWIVCEKGLKGTLNQCIGVAESLGVEPHIIDLTLQNPWKSLSPYLGFECSRSFGQSFASPWPELLIAGGRKSIAASRYIKKMSGGKTFTVQLQDPRISPKHFDLVAAPAHDPVRGDNVIITTATPNRITPQRLVDARHDFTAFMDLPAPRVAVLIGGDSKAYRLTHDIMIKLSLRLSRLKDASLMVTTSRRTGKENEGILREHIDFTKHYLWDGHEPNPYFGMLSWADYILVTADSASMLSEACTTGKPVYMIDMERVNKSKVTRIDKLHQKLQELGAVRRFEGVLEDWDYAPLDDAALVANEIRKRMSI